MKYVSKEEVISFLNSLQWERTTKKEIELKLQDFFGIKNEIVDSTCKDDMSIDYSFIFSNENKKESHNFIDVEIYYLKTRQRNHIFITETEILGYYMK